jgi:hypothetical protein
MLYEVLTGRPPFTGQRPVEVVKKVLTEEWGAAPRMCWSDAYAIGKWHMPPWVHDPEIAGGGIMMSEGVHLAPGVYWVRLTQARHRPSTRMVVVAR